MRKILPCAVAATLLLSGVSLIAQEVPQEKQVETKIYIMPGEVKCYIRKQDRLTICTDLEGKPITGELRKYQENELVRRYPLVKGIIEGTVISYYTNGDVLSEKPYTKGKLNGVVKTYYKNNKIESITPYQNGVKEGVVKFYYNNGYMQEQGIYIGGKLNGQYRLYDKSGDMVYELTFQNNSLASGYCMYKKKENDDKRYKQELDANTLEMIKKHEVVLDNTIVVNGCSMKRGKKIK